MSNLSFSTKFVLVATALTMSFAGWCVAIAIFCAVVIVGLYGWIPFFFIYGAIFGILWLCWALLMAWFKANPTDQERSRQLSTEALKEIRARRK
jgi:hypothetical protein